MTLAGNLIAAILPNIIIPYFGFTVIGRWDSEEAPQPTNDICIQILLMAVAAAACGAVVMSSADGYGSVRFYDISDSVLLGMVSGSMIFAGITDILISKVYDFIWWIAIAAELAIYIHHPVSLWKLVCLAVFFMLQELVFSKLYGRADCHAFCICAVMESIFGMDITGFLIHMLLAFTFLAVVQCLKRNVGDRGRLKVPVPFIPYIIMTFWMNLLIGNYIDKIYFIKSNTFM